MPPRAAALLAAAAMAAAASLATAADGERPSPPAGAEGYLDAGPFHLRPGLALKDLGYDSNVFLTRDDRVGDYTATLAPSLEAVLLLGHRGRLDLKQELDLVGFLETSSQNHADSRSTARWWAFLGDFTYRGGLRHETARLRPSEEIDQRVRYQGGTLESRLSWSRGERTLLAASAEHRRMGYAGDPRFFGNNLSDLDRDETTALLEARLPLRPKTQALVEASRTWIDHRRPGLGRDVVSQRLVAGVLLDASALLQGEVRYGVLSFRPEDPARAGYSGPVGQAALRYRVLRRLRLGAEYARDLEFSVFGDNLYYRRQTVGLSAATALTRRFHLEAGGSRSTLSYPVPVPLPAGDLLREDTIHQAWVGWSYAPPGGPRYGVRVVRWDRDSNLDAEDDAQVRVVGEASYVF